jgi:hypothetical protein
MKLLYKIKPQITNIKKPKGEYSINVVLGSAEEINNEKKEEALTYIKNAPELPSGYIDLAENYHYTYFLVGFALLLNFMWCGGGNSVKMSNFA